MLYALSTYTHTHTHTACEAVGMVKVSGKLILNEFINQIRKKKKQKCPVPIVKKTINKRYYISFSCA
jgi:hypothetical protein